MTSDPLLVAAGNDPLALVETLKLKHKLYDGNHILLDYHMIDSPKKHPVVDRCRGTVLKHTQGEGCSYARRMFDRFYNLGEYPEVHKHFDWDSAVVEEKADGSLIGVWYNEPEDTWEIGTRGNAMGDNKMTTLSGEEGSIAFKDLFLRAWGGGYKFDREFAECYGGRTYMFELCCIENKIVTSYPEDTIYLLGVRHNKTGKYESAEELDKLAEHYFKGVKRPQRYQLKSFEEVMEASHHLPNLQEGFVLYDKNDMRIKVKSLAYVTAHHLRGEGVTPKRATLMALAGEVEEFCSYFPEYRALLMPYVEQVAKVLHEAQFAYDSLKHIPCQKLFAQRVQEGWPDYQALLFTMRNKDVGLTEAVAGLKDSSKLNIFKPRYR